MRREGVRHTPAGIPATVERTDALLPAVLP